MGFQLGLSRARGSAHKGLKTNLLSHNNAREVDSVRVVLLSGPRETKQNKSRRRPANQRRVH